MAESLLLQQRKYYCKLILNEKLKGLKGLKD
ncbi:hypothetical protein BC670_2733 [Flavobacterium branchiophilum]|uniref:Uncharacterized protein n=1 Tax=Flavobacterium branchiophilum TaxID=55197 RepID=A0A543G6N5_9FLAO|nr:hypothetical protein BC670_2733 [Flavobacterium branchiophilum]